jgi:two-component system, chemotaxis family, CheB/CheR fusion protein
MRQPRPKRPKGGSRRSSASRGAPRVQAKKRGVRHEAGERAPVVTQPIIENGPVEDARPRESGGFPIVGIGASAGGLEALEAFLKGMPERCGMAFVVIQHLDPTHKGAMVELLQRATRMPVLQVKDGMKVEPDRVYVIPPNKNLSILQRVLHLLPQTAPRGLNLPIDGFFRSLAEDQQERSIGVVLSGMGSDGTLGLRAIKEKAGAAFVQEPSSAKFDGMPRSAIEAGLADVVVPVEELPGKLVAYRQHTPYIALAEPYVPQVDKALSALENVYILLRARTGNDFSLYKKSTVYRRVERRMGLHQIDKIANYVRYLRENPKEVELLFKELLIGVTNFFRDPPAWEHLAREVMPSLLTGRASGSVVRAWVPGCSTGEEAYSVAMVFKEVMDRIKAPRNLVLQIFATDLDRDAIEQARQGLYPANIAADVPPERLRRFFVQEERGYRVSKDIRELVVFAPQNVTSDPPFTKLDIISCRNLLIYLSPELQKRLVPLFHYSLNPGGILILGSAETIGAFSSLFAAVDGKARIYRRLEATSGGPPIDFPSSLSLSPPGTLAGSHGQSRDAKPPNLEALAERVLVQRFSPASVLASDEGDILYTSGRTGKYLEPSAGKANWNVFAMAREGLRFELSSAFSAALRQDGPATAPGVEVGTNEGTQLVDITVQKLAEPKELRGMVMIVFADAPSPQAEARAKPHRLPARHSARVADLENELQHARDEVQSIREEMQTSQEQLKSTNEQFQSTNEELQSTNEELTTSKEEMQSLNEELQTVNHELQAKVDELSRSNNDMMNLFNSTEVATLFLDGDLQVRRFTTQTSKIIKLIPSDAGRPITDIVTQLDYPALPDDAREVLRTLVFKETIVPARGGRWFTVRIMPYRTLENVIDGVVITFQDASAAKGLEQALLQKASEMRNLADSLPALVWTCHPDGTRDVLSRQWIEYTGSSEVGQPGFGWLTEIHPDDRERVKARWEAALESGETFHMDHQLRGKDGSYRWFKTQAVPIRDGEGKILKWCGTSTDVDDLKRADEEKKAASDRLASILEGIGEGFFALDQDLVVTYFNAAAERALGHTRQAVLGKPFFDAFPELRSSALDGNCRQALRDRVPLTFEGYLERRPYEGWYEVRIYPHAGGISVFFERRNELRSPSPDGEEPVAGDAVRREV